MTQEPEITTISEKGQVVIPMKIRESLRIKPRTKFIVSGRGDTIVMKMLELPDVQKEWNEIFKMMDKKNLKMTEKEVDDSVRSHRKERRKKDR